MSNVVDIRAPMRLGLAASIIMLAGIIGWSTQARLSSAVVASGVVDLAPLRHPVQSRIGGRVAEVLVREGQSVTAGEVVLRFERGTLEREHSLLTAQIAQIEAQLLRLDAERLGQPPQFPEHPIGVMLEESAFYAARKLTFEGRLAQLELESEQIQNARTAIGRQLTANDYERVLVEQDLHQQNELVARGIITSARRTALERDAARLQAAHAALLQQQADFLGRLEQLEVQAQTLRAMRVEEAQSQAIEARARHRDLTARLAELDDQIDRLDLRAPVSGLVHGLAIGTAGAVLRPAEIAMQIVPINAEPSMALRVRPDDIEYLRLEQNARLHFPALERFGLAELDGAITAISAATFSDEQTGGRHFRVEIALTNASLQRLGGTPLLPGMSVQAFLTTGESAPLTYLLAPILRHLRGALREP